MKTKKYIILLIMIVILSVGFNVNAETTDEYSIKLTSSNTTLEAGDIITISLKVDNINIQSGEKGIGAYEGTIVYDSNIFEDLKMSGNDVWDTPIENEGRFTSVKSDGICTNQSQEVAKITLKVKENASLGSTKIEIKDFEASNGEKNISTVDTELTIKIGKTTSDVDTNSNITNTNRINTGEAQNKLPYAGISETLVIFILVVAIVGIFSYIKYKRTY